MMRKDIFDLLEKKYQDLYYDYFNMFKEDPPFFHDWKTVACRCDQFFWKVEQAIKTKKKIEAMEMADFLWNIKEKK